MSQLALRKAHPSYVEISRFWRRFCGISRSRGNYGSIRSIEQSVQQVRRQFSNATSFLRQMPKGNAVLEAFNNRSPQPIRVTVTPVNESTRHVSGILEEFSQNPIERSIEVHGYLGVRSDLSKSLSFVSLKDAGSEETIQIVSVLTEPTSHTHNKIKSVRPYEPVTVSGLLRPKLPKRANDDMNGTQSAMKTPEILLQGVTVWNSLPPDIILKDGAEYGPEQRSLRLRTDATLSGALRVRSRMMHMCNLGLPGFKFVETPLLYKSTSEGANEYLVPTRRKGLAYALPQSPQQFKQVLMASGVHQYYQFARCFRDEDLRADRQPEFTQLDIEASFTSGHQIREIVTNQIIAPMWMKFLNVKLPMPFRCMSYNMAMSEYGSDKPDLRIPFKIRPAIQSILPTDLVGKITPLSDPIVDAMIIPLEVPPDQVRALVSQFLDSADAVKYHDNPDGGPAIFIYDSSKPLQGLSAFGFEAVEKIAGIFSGLGDGNLIVLQARKKAPFSGGSTELGNMRVALHSAAVNAGWLPSLPWKYFEPLWITDFPLFSPSTDDEPGQGGQAGFKSTHHPFTSPKNTADVDLLLTDPTKAIGDHYDLVINGEEIGGGSRRIHQAAMQEFIFREVLKMKEENIVDFAPLLEALRTACPPHAGIALGFDRLVAMVCSHMFGRKVSMKDVIAFPKSGSGDDLMMKSPAKLTEDQLTRYHLKMCD